jgi:PEP-CTERM motif
LPSRVIASVANYFTPMKTKSLSLSLLFTAIFIFTTQPLMAGLSYNFSFTGDPSLGDGIRPGATDTIGGIITLNDAGTAATSVYVTSNTYWQPLFNSSFNFVDDNYLVLIGKGPDQRNAFTVVNGIITSANFGSALSMIEWKDGWGGLNYYQFINGLEFDTSANGVNIFQYGSTSNYYAMNWTRNDSGSSGVTFSPAVVPEPSTYGLIGIGALGVAFAARRRKANVA